MGLSSRNRNRTLTSPSDAAATHVTPHRSSTTASRADRATSRHPFTGVSVSAAEVQTLFGLDPDELQVAILLGELEQTSPGWISARSVQAYLQGVTR